MEREEFSKALFDWYQTFGRTLPWQKESDPYKVMVAVVMLQQTQVATVIPYYERFIEKLPTIPALARVSEEALFKLWEGLGYYTRARNLKKAAQRIVEENQGIFPRDFLALRQLPGIGDYSAGAILSISFQDPYMAIDGNLYRIFARLLGLEKTVDDPELRRIVMAKIQKLLPNDRPGDFNQALMDLGATVCLGNARPLCERCPFPVFCKANQMGSTEAIPVKKIKKAKKIENKSVFLIWKDNQIALIKRAKSGLLANMWELPNTDGAMDLGQSASWLETVGIHPESLVIKKQYRHHFSHITWNMTGFEVVTLKAPEELGFVWVSREELVRRISMPKAFSPLLDFV